MNKGKVGIGLDKNYNYAYYRVIGELNEKPQSNYFVMRFKRGTPQPKKKIHGLRGTMNCYTKGTLTEQECVFKVINADNLGIILAELIKDGEN